ncbi:MAG: zinc ribbon domain-containing protein [Clostridia bacterium]|nr:zinc ribbon domain-containing protein [Clostridia bacterium]
MTTCSNCNAQVQEELAFCPQCGTAVNASEAATPAQSEANASADLSQKLSVLNNTADTTEEYDVQDIEKNKIMAVLAYIIFLIPLIAAKDSPFARFHTNQGLIIFIAALISSVAAIIPIIGWILAPIIGVAVTVLAVIGIINALGGKAKELPIVGKFKILK